MRNHNDKTRDMARSVLPSTARRAARQNRRIIHGRERAAERRLLHDLLACPDPDDYDNDVAWEDRPSRRDMIIYRRNADKVGSLIRWAERTVATHPRLADATLEDRLTYFRAVLPPGLIGDHAVLHIEFAIDPERQAWRERWRARRRAEPPTRPEIAMVEAIVAAGLHGELNARIGRFRSRHRWVRREEPIPPEGPPPGVLVIGRSMVVRYPRRYRFLAGAHDVETFVAEADLDVLNIVRDLAGELENPARD